MSILFLLCMMCPLSYGALPGTGESSGVSAKNIGLSIAALGLAYYATYTIVRYATQNAPVSVDLVDLDLEKNQEVGAPQQQNYLFAHGIASNHKQVMRYTSLIASNRAFTYDYPDVTRNFYRVNFWYTALGQDYEVRHFKDAYDKTQAVLKAKNQVDNGLVLMGISRGAATILNFMGHYKPKNIKALILESPFDCTKSITNNKITQCGLGKIPGIETIGHAILSSIFWQHNRNGQQAIDSIENLDKNVPILLICSKQDSLVPTASTIALYQKLLGCGHTNTHIFIAEQGKHGKIIEGPDKEKYQHAVDAFNQKYRIAAVFKN